MRHLSFLACLMLLQTYAFSAEMVTLEDNPAIPPKTIKEAVFTYQLKRGDGFRYIENLGKVYRHKGDDGFKKIFKVVGFSQNEEIIFLKNSERIDDISSSKWFIDAKPLFESEDKSLDLFSEKHGTESYQIIGFYLDGRILLERAVAYYGSATDFFYLALSKEQRIAMEVLEKSKGTSRFKIGDDVYGHDIHGVVTGFLHNGDVIVNNKYKLTPISLTPMKTQISFTQEPDECSAESSTETDNPSEDRAKIFFKYLCIENR